MASDKAAEREKKKAEKQRVKSERAAAAEAARQERQRAAEELARARQRAEAEAAFLASPQGQARLAAQAGQSVFQISLPLRSTQRTLAGILGGDKMGIRVVQGEHTDVLSAIESEGWRLEHAGYVFHETGSVSRDKMFSTGQTATVTGETWGVYIFRRQVSQGWDVPKPPGSQ